MPKQERGTEAARVYRRAACELAEHQVVAAAEDILTDEWIEELEQLRASLLQVVASASRTDFTGASEPLGNAPQAPQDGDLGPIPAVDPAAELNAVDELAFRRLELQEAGSLLADLDTALESACATGVERARSIRRDLERLRSLEAGACHSDAG